LEVTVGSTVTWENHDDMPHTVVHDAHPADFSSPPLDTDDKFSYRFTKPGTYAYYCSMHPRMTGVIIVK
jgi:plastocyanin